ncbi:Protein of unknown function [Roseateles sp. YR242]|uniref:DUF2726 domain-containing protein n=1 Tax=Roseateles sp. YR242 TaxID=1855305 RepID=UPI0008BB815B|nr:DUF2726 domain-containing protein [Roseateles sp. YR242]SEL74043.1 Protein of unknown function [Roseateles sp. YR242]
MQNTLPWLIAGLCGLAMLSLLVVLLLRRPQRRRKPLPTEWSLTARPVFSADERRVFRLLREALPHHVVMAKLPLVRFCQPTEARDVRYWYDLLGGISVNFAICSPNGRVLAAVDLETERPGTARSLQIKQEVLAACRIRYLRLSADNMPTVSELQLLVPYSNQSARSPQPMQARPTPARPSVAPAPAAAASPAAATASAASRRVASRNTLWNESPVFSDSFFAPDSRFDSFNAPAEAPPPHAVEPRQRGYRPRGGVAGSDSSMPDSQFLDDGENDIAGVVVDAPRYLRR